MKMLVEFVQKIRVLTSEVEPWWTIALVPIWQEVVFRWLPYQFWYLPTDNFLLVGIVSSITFALIHWYFGGWFVVAAFVAGLFYWWVMVEFGLMAAILVHALVNFIDISFGLRQLLIEWSK